MTERRKYLSASEKARVVLRQSGRCACGCGEKLQPGKIEFDHVRSLAMGGTNDLDNFQALIRKHHRMKSDKENSERARADRAGRKHRGEWLNAKDRELSRILSRVKQIGGLE